MDSALDPAVLAPLRGGALAPALGKPVADVLHGLGLPGLPSMAAAPPLPGLPPLPVIDLEALAKPLTDLASGFGTGKFPVPEPDTSPIQVLQATGAGAQQAMHLGTSAMQLVSALWQGSGADSAAATQNSAARSAGQLSAQSTAQKTVLAAAAGTVATGAADMAAVIGKFTTTAALTAPFLVTPPGQAFMLENTIESLTEALAVLAQTRAQMTAHSAGMTGAGAKVRVTSAPRGVSTTSGQQLGELMQLIQPLLSATYTGTQHLATVGTTAVSGTATPIDTSAVDPTVSGFPSESGTVPVGGAGVAAPATPLSSWRASHVVGAAAGGPRGVGAAVDIGAVEPMPASEPISDPGMYAMPMSGGVAAVVGAGPGAGAMGARGDAGLVAGGDGDRVVGPVTQVSEPVVGAVARKAEAPPDEDLRL